MVALNRLVSRSGLEGPLESHSTRRSRCRDLLVRTLPPLTEACSCCVTYTASRAQSSPGLVGLKPEAVRKRLQRAGERLARAYDLLKDTTVEEETAHVRADASI